VARYNSSLNVQQHPFELAVLDLSQLRSPLPGNLPAQVNILAEQLLAALPDPAPPNHPLVLALKQIYASAQKFDYDSSQTIDPHDGYVDLVDFTQLLRDSNNPAISSDIKTAAADVVTAANDATKGTPVIRYNRTVSGRYEGNSWTLGHANGLSIFLPLGEQDYRPTHIDPTNPTKPAQAERQLGYYIDPAQLAFTRNVPQWAALLLRLEPTVPIIRTGPGGLPTATFSADQTIDTRPFSLPFLLLPHRFLYLPLVRR
jgi:hypothetical protein